jgi:peptide deformylase
MAVRDILQLGDERLTNENLEIKDFNDEKIRQVITDLADTMKEKELVGIAAPQIGENFKIFITEPRETQFRSKDQADELRVFINPKIIEKSSEEIIIYEGCGSVARSQIFGPVSRPKTIIIEANDEKGKRFLLKCDGLLSRVIQHENDHLSGIEFIEKISDYTKLVSPEAYGLKIKDSVEQLTNSIITIKEVTKL